MKRSCVRVQFLAPVLVLVFLPSAHAQSPTPDVTSDLGGTSWRLLKFQGSDGKTLTPDNSAKYTIAFDSDGRVSVRIDCNRGHGTWKSVGASQIEFAPLALTRAMCPPAALNDRMPKDWLHLRSYILKHGHLLLSLMGDRGVYEFEPLNREQHQDGATISGLPATFIGTLPCADCPGIRYQVDLLPDHSFVSRMTYEERSTRLDDRGHWQLAPDGKTLVLQGGSGAPQKFAVADGDTLRKLDIDGHEIVSRMNYDLKRVATFTPIETHAQETANASLENTDWKLILLGDSPVNVSPQKQPHFLLDSTTKRVSGFGGCNRLVGNYLLDGDHLAFGQTAGTMMACLEGMEMEKVFLELFSQVNSWKIKGQRLELFDTSGKRIASFEAR